MNLIRPHIVFLLLVLAAAKIGTGQILAIRPTALTDPHIAPLIISNYPVDSLSLIHKYVKRWNKFEYDKKDVKWVRLTDSSMVEFYQSILFLVCRSSDDGQATHKEHGIEFYFLGAHDNQAKRIFIKDKEEALKVIDDLIGIIAASEFIGHNVVLTELYGLKERCQLE